jgi:chemotaxis-related protein WspD
MSESLPLVTHDVECWNRIGIGGDRSCPELKTHIHCRSCPVHTRAARTFFDRPAPEGYLAEWTRLLAQEKQGHDGDHVSVLIFRLHDEWLALAARALAEVTDPRPVHRIPHRTNAILEGLVNIRGQLLLCVSLHGLLGVEPAAPPSAGESEGGEGKRESLPRIVVIEKKTERWAFLADEVRSVHRIPQASLRGLPSTLSRAADRYSQAVFTWRDRSVGLLDEQRVIAGLGGLGR